MIAVIGMDDDSCNIKNIGRKRRRNFFAVIVFSKRHKCDNMSVIFCDKCRLIANMFEILRGISYMLFADPQITLSR